MEIWNSFNDELDRRLNHVHIQMEQTIKQEDLFRLKFLRDEVNGPKPN